MKAQFVLGNTETAIEVSGSSLLVSVVAERLKEANPSAILRDVIEGLNCGSNGMTATEKQLIDNCVSELINLRREWIQKECTAGASVSRGEMG